VQIVGYINTNKDHLHCQKWKLCITLNTTQVLYFCDMLLLQCVVILFICPTCVRNGCGLCGCACRFYLFCLVRAHFTADCVSWVISNKAAWPPPYCSVINVLVRSRIYKGLYNINIFTALRIKRFCVIILIPLTMNIRWSKFVIKTSQVKIHFQIKIKLFANFVMFYKVCFYNFITSLTLN